MMARPFIAARPTVYAGIQMRSRLEAKYAKYLDDLGFEWEYEPRCFASQAGQYLPDFYVVSHTGNAAYVEVKPYIEDDTDDQLDEYLRRMAIIWDSEPDAWLLLCEDEQNRCWSGLHGRWAWVA